MIFFFQHYNFPAHCCKSSPVIRVWHILLWKSLQHRQEDKNTTTSMLRHCIFSPIKTHSTDFFLSQLWDDSFICDLQPCWSLKCCSCAEWTEPECLKADSYIQFSTKKTKCKLIKKRKIFNNYSISTSAQSPSFFFDTNIPQCALISPSHPVANERKKRLGAIIGGRKWG